MNLRDITTLALVKAADAPFFPRGKAKFALPDLGPKSLPNAPWNRLGEKAFSIKPQQFIAPYYKHMSGGYDKALSQASNYQDNFNPSKGLWSTLMSEKDKYPIPMKEPAGPFGDFLKERGTYSPPLPAQDFLQHIKDKKDEINLRNFKPDLRSLNRPVPVLPNSKGGTGFYMHTDQDLDGEFALPGTSKINWDKSSLDGSGIRPIPNHYKDTETMLRVPAHSLLEHEAGHAYIEGAGSRLAATAAAPYISDGEKYFDRPMEEDQGMARTNRETAALTGRRVGTPQQYQQLLKEINPTDQNEDAFEKRVAPYSAEGQRYWRYLRDTHSDDARQYQKSVERGAERMPLFVRNQKLQALQNELS